MPRGKRKPKKEVETAPKQGSKPSEVLPMLGPNQKYFEAPDGTILVGDAEVNQVWYRAGNMWINPKR